jgi:hypothetical protein
MSNINQLFNPNRMMDRLFRKVENVAWDLMTGRVAVATKDGLVGLEMTEVDDGAGNKETTFQTVENPFTDMSMPIPAFAQQTALDAVKQGDLIVKGNITGWVTKINKASVKIIKPDGTHTEFTPPKTAILDFGSGLMVVRSLFNMMPGGQAGVNNLQGMLMPMMMMGALDGDTADNMIPMMLMMSGALTTSGNPADAAQAANPMMANMQQMMPMLMMSGMMKGKGGGGSPFNFGSKPPFNR